MVQTRRATITNGVLTTLIAALLVWILKSLWPYLRQLVLSAGKFFVSRVSVPVWFLGILVVVAVGVLAVVALVAWAVH
jgi:hypothetical protein